MVLAVRELMSDRHPDFGLYFSNPKIARKWFDKQKFTNTTFFFKASRGIAIERIIS
jgi:hypothetical protein